MKLSRDATYKDRRLRKKRRRLLQLERENPNTCYCHEWGHDVPRLNSDEFVRMSGTMYRKFDYYKEDPFQLPIRRCSRCGKEYTAYSIAVAWFAPP